MMQNIKNRIYANIGQISIWIGSVSLFTHIIMSFSSKLSFLHHFQIVYIYDWFGRFFPSDLKSTITRFPFSPVSSLFFLMLIIGGILYQKTDKKDSRLLRFGFSSIFLYKLIALFTFPSLYFQNKQNYPSIPAMFKIAKLTNLDLIFTFLATIVVLIISFSVTKWLQADQKLRLEETIRKNGTIVYTGMKANLDKRFVHFLFDKVLAIYFVVPFVMSMTIYLMSSINPNLMQSFVSQKWIPFIILSISLFIYYIIFEGIFSATPVKFLTGTRVVDMYKFENATFGHVVGRTICRFIPFDSLSFFWTGWHDDFSETLVVEEENHGQNRRYHIWWIVAFILIYLIPYLYLVIKQERIQKENNRISAQHTESKKKSSIYNLDNGDFLKACRDRSDYKSPHYLLKVISSDNTSVQIERYLLGGEQRYLEKKYIVEFNLKELDLIDTLKILKDSLMVTLNKYDRTTLVNDTISLNIENVYSVNHPEIRSGAGSYYLNEKW